MKKTITALLAAGLLASLTASAQTNASAGLNYNYVEANLALYPGYDFGFGPGDEDFIGPRIRGSVLVIPEVFLFGQFRYLSDDVDYTQMHAGAAYRHEVADDTDVYGGLSLEYVDLDFPGAGGSADDLGFGFRGGLRHRLNEDVELGGELRYVNIGGDIDNDYVGFTGTLQYFVTDALGLIGEFDVEDGELGLLGGARLNF